MFPKVFVLCLCDSGNFYVVFPSNCLGPRKRRFFQIAQLQNWNRACSAACPHLPPPVPKRHVTQVGGGSPGFAGRTSRSIYLNIWQSRVGLCLLDQLSHTPGSDRPIPEGSVSSLWVPSTRPNPECSESSEIFMPKVLAMFIQVSYSAGTWTPRGDGRGLTKRLTKRASVQSVRPTVDLRD